MAVIRVLTILAFLPIVALAQLAQPEVRTETDLAEALYRSNSDRQSIESLLSAHQQLVNDRLWTYLNGLARVAYFNQSPQQSIETYQAAILVAGRLQNSKLLARSYYNIGVAYSGLNQYPKAIASYEKSREYFEQEGLQRDLIYVLADLGALYFIVENYDKARDRSYQSLVLADNAKTSVHAGTWPDDVGRARALATLAEIDSRDGDYTQAIERLQESLALHQKPSLGSIYVANDLASLGRVYTTVGDYAKGLFYLNQALEIVKGQREPQTLASLFNSIGFLYLEQEDYPQAKQQFDQSLQIYRTESNQREAARVLLNLGVTAQRKGDYGDALEYFKQSAQAAKATQLVDGQIAAGEGIGVVLTAKKDFVGALEVLKQSLALARDMKDKTRQAELLWRTAQTYYEMANYAQSAVLSEEALELARTVHSPKLIYLATTTLGESYTAQNKLDLAKQTLRQAVRQLEMMRGQVAGSEIESQLFLENKVASYQALVDLHIQQDELLDALLMAERAKSRVLLDVLSGGKSYLQELLKPADKEESQRLNRKISQINDRIKTGEREVSPSLDSLYRELEAARLEYQMFQDGLYVAYPDLRLRNGHTSPLTSADLKDLLIYNHAYLEYAVTDERVYLFVLTRTGASEDLNLKVYSLATKSEELRRKVDQFQKRLADRRPDFASLGHELYATLIEPAALQLRGISAICVVPDGFLWNLPFQALLSKDDRYVLEEHALFYAPSLSVLSEMIKRAKARTKGSKSLLALGDPLLPVGEQGNSECPLPEAETEVTAIARSFAKPKAKIFTGREAGEKTFKTLAPSYSFLHLATHGVIDNRQPLYSHLLLTKTEGDVEDDGRLEAREIMNLKLNADLAVLSACETANGRIAPGEGVMGMSWSFFVAGTRSLVVSQWKVSSESTSQFMSSFYQTLQSKPSPPQTKASALRTATLLTMKNNRYRHPFYWAPYVLIGTN